MRAHRAKPLLLVLDDDEAVRETWALIFGQQGYEVVTVERGQDAIEAARRVAPDVLLADIRLPDMTGVEAAWGVQQAAPWCRILLISGDSSSAPVLDEARARGLTFEVLPKPISPPDLLRRVADRLRHR